jgi:glycosyltransferase involved in cell wall biosynthesis
MKLSVVIRTRNEADRLRLVLTSLERQTDEHEVIVVDDGSSDHTQGVLDDMASRLPLRSVRHDEAHGRSAASNAGARISSGDALLFLDGDTLACPDFLKRHIAAHCGPDVIARGETLHIRATRFLQNPEACIPYPEHADRLSRASEKDLARMRISRHQVLFDFEAIHSRSNPGIYPGAGPERLYSLEMDALRNHPECAVLWAAASGHNLSVDRERFLSSGGFDEEIDFIEQRELALRMCKHGARMVSAEGARSYHLNHRQGWRDPLSNTEWEDRFYAVHRLPAVKLLIVFWASIGSHPGLANQSLISSLPELEAAATDPLREDLIVARELIMNKNNRTEAHTQ